MRSLWATQEGTRLHEQASAAGGMCVEGEEGREGVREGGREGERRGLKAFILCCFELSLDSFSPSFPNLRLVVPLSRQSSRLRRWRFRQRGTRRWCSGAWIPSFKVRQGLEGGRTGTDIFLMHESVEDGDKAGGNDRLAAPMSEFMGPALEAPPWP